MPIASSRATDDHTISVPEAAIAIAITSRPLIDQPNEILKKLAISGKIPAKKLEMNLIGPTSATIMPISLTNCMIKKPTPSVSDMERKNCHISKCPLSTWSLAKMLEKNKRPRDA